MYYGAHLYVYVCIYIYIYIYIYEFGMSPEHFRKHDAHAHSVAETSQHAIRCSAKHQFLFKINRNTQQFGMNLDVSMEYNYIMI